MRLLPVRDPGASSRGGNCWNVLQREHGHGHMSNHEDTVCRDPKCKAGVHCEGHCANPWRKAMERGTAVAAPDCDAVRYRWLKERLMGFDFESKAIEEGAGWALVFCMPEGSDVPGDLDRVVDAAMNVGSRPVGAPAVDAPENRRWITDAEASRVLSFLIEHERDAHRAPEDYQAHKFAAKLVPDANCLHCKGTGKLIFDDLPGDVYQCKCLSFQDGFNNGNVGA